MRSDPIDEYYGILGVSQEASLAELKTAFKKLALRHHPDKNRDRLEEAEAEFKKVKEAYDVFSRLPKYKNDC